MATPSLSSEEHGGCCVWCGAKAYQPPKVCLCERCLAAAQEGLPSKPEAQRAEIRGKVTQ